MQRLVLLGLNHSTAPLEVRERLAFNNGERCDALRAIRRRFPECEAVLLSTCNRIELYVARALHGVPRHQEMASFLGELRNVAVEQFQSYSYELSERDVIEHLFSVAASLDSMVVGETQILGQVREAYDAAREAQTVGPSLNPLFQRALAVGKQVMTETTIAEGRRSIASVAIECANRIFETFSDKTVLSIGAGKMANLVLQGFASLKPKRLLICNRDASKADELATRHNGQPAPFEKLDEHLVAADIVVSSTGSTRPIITRSRFETLLRQRRYRPIFLIDIAMPRDVEASVGELKNVYLYNLDDLQQVISATCTQRAGAVEAATRIIDTQVEQYVRWHRVRELGPFIDRLYERHHRLAREELERTLSKLPNVSSAERAHLEQLARRIVNKLLHDPIRALRDTGTLHPVGPVYLHAIEKLFQLEESESMNDVKDLPESSESPDARSDA